jgi:hypothetical protein
MTNRLHPDDLDALAEKVAERLAVFIPDLVAAAHVARMVDAKECARELRVSRDYVYDHRAELGGEKVAGIIRFDLERARAAFAASPSPVSSAPPRRRRTGRRARELLPVKDDRA